MVTTLNQRYQVDVTGAADDFSPDKIIGQETDGIRRWVRNGTWVWSYHNRRRLLHWTAGPTFDTPLVGVNGGLPNPWVTYVAAWRGLANMSPGRQRVELWTDAQYSDIRLSIYQRDLTTLIGTLTNSHGGLRSQISNIGTFAGLLTNPDIFLEIEVQQNGAGPYFIWSHRVMEFHILQANL